jgi:hypothetical protein
MFTWKRLSWVLSIFATVLATLHFSNAPQVSAQIKPAMVRSVDEPTRVPYLVSAKPNCPFGNDCFISGTTVPAGKRLRITRIEGALLGQAGDTFAALHIDTDRNPVAIFPTPVFNGFFYGTVVGFSHDVDYYYEAGQTPVLEIGCSAVNTISTDSRNKLTLIGYITDTTP